MYLIASTKTLIEIQVLFSQENTFLNVHMLKNSA